MHEIDMKNYEIRTDLVVDMIENINIEDISTKHEESKNIKILDIYLNKENKINKKEGRYITISFEDITDKENRYEVEEVFIKCLKDMINDIDKNNSCLVVGLGNDKSTPDSLGPITINKVLVTRYLSETGNLKEGYKIVSTITPGVSGTTGIETFDIISGIVDKINPDFLIIIDALASSSIDRINKTIQITNTGIIPGSGVGNKRKELTFETLNRPVIAIGVPTVVDAVTIVSDTFEYILKKFSYSKDNINKLSEKLVVNRNYENQKINLTDEEQEKLLGMIGTLTQEDKKKLIYEVLSPLNYNLMVTVKEIDFIIEKLADIISNGINKSLHKNFK